MAVKLSDILGSKFLDKDRASSPGGSLWTMFSNSGDRKKQAAELIAARKQFIEVLENLKDSEAPGVITLRVLMEACIREVDAGLAKLSS